MTDRPARFSYGSHVRLHTGGVGVVQRVLPRDNDAWWYVVAFAGSVRRVRESDLAADAAPWHDSAGQRRVDGAEYEE